MHKAVVIAISTGGPPLLREVVPELCRLLSLPICIVQHMPVFIADTLVRSLGQSCMKTDYTVKLAEHGETISDRHVYLAPGDQHMYLGSGMPVRMKLNSAEPENGCRPSADVLFRSAARVLGRNTVAVVMTGMGRDGAKGCVHIKTAGGAVIVQDRDSSAVWGMPRVVQEAGMADVVAPAVRIPEAVARMCKMKGMI